MAEEIDQRTQNVPLSSCKVAKLVEVSGRRIVHARQDVREGGEFRAVIGGLYRACVGIPCYSCYD
jgi:hypothetical protein